MNILYIYKYIEIWSEDQRTVISYLIVADSICVGFTFGLSVIYHTFMNHHGGLRVYNTLLKLDVFGIWLLAMYGSLPPIYTTFYCHTMLFNFIITLNLVLSLILLWYMFKNGSLKFRVVAFVTQYIIRILVILIRLTSLGEGLPRNTIYYIILEVFCTLGFIVNTFRIPERWLPGKLDYYFNSHNLMHIATTLAILAFKTALLMDIEWINSKPICN